MASNCQTWERRLCFKNHKTTLKFDHLIYMATGHLNSKTYIPYDVQYMALSNIETEMKTSVSVVKMDINELHGKLGHLSEVMLRKQQRK